MSTRATYPGTRRVRGSNQSWRARSRYLGLWGICLALGACQSGPDTWADLVVLNGNVITVDGTRPRAKAFAVLGDKFIAVGSTSEIHRWVGESTTVGRARSLSLDVYDQWRVMEEGSGKWRFTSPTHTVRAFAQALADLRGKRVRHPQNKRTGAYPQPCSPQFSSRWTCPLPKRC